jgi:hypothetical protein
MTLIGWQVQRKAIPPAADYVDAIRIQTQGDMMRTFAGPC